MPYFHPKLNFNQNTTTFIVTIAFFNIIVSKPLTLTAVEGSIGGIIGIAVLIAVLYCIIVKIRMCLKQRKSHPEMKRQTTQFYSMGENPQLQWL